MTFHPRSIIAFGQFFNKVFDSVVSGAPLEEALELIREEFTASAVVLAIENHDKPNESVVCTALAKEQELGNDVTGPLRGIRTIQARDLSRLLEACHHSKATKTGADRAIGYTLLVCRPSFGTSFDQDEQSVCEILVSHLARGIEMASRMGATEIERSLYSDVVDRLCVGMVILDRTGRIVRTSQTADRILAERDSVQIQGGRLRAASANEDKELQVCVKAALQNVANGDPFMTRGLSLTKRSGSKSLGLIVRPIDASARGAFAANATVAVYLRDPEAIPEIEGELVRQLFDLTPAEAAVARRLTVGLSLDEAAHSLDISRNTARAHLRSIFSKSGITRQTELVRLLLNSVVLLGERPRQAA